MVVVLAAAVVLALWWPGTKGLIGNELVSARFEAVRIGLSIGVGSGGIIALYLLWRRQQVMEDTLAHQELVAQSTEEDARERRITDLYTRAADQLGSDKAAVRQAGLYALERLAQDYPTQRNAIVNLLCAYLRMPFDLPASSPMEFVDSGGSPDRDAPDRNDREAGIADGALERQRHRDLVADHREQTQEREVRLAAQRLLIKHARPGPGGVDNPDATYWPNLDLDLTGATLVAPDFSDCHVGTFSVANAYVSGAARFDQVRFAGDASFAKARFDGGVSFTKTRFAGRAMFSEVRFDGDAWFYEAEFASDAMFGEIRCARGVRFSKARFAGDARFSKAEFAGAAWFDEADVAGTASFGHARFAGPAWFNEARFGGATSFSEARFADSAWLNKAEFSAVALFILTEFAAFTSFDGAKFASGTWFSHARFTGETSFEEARFDHGTMIEGATFAHGVRANLPRHVNPTPMSNLLPTGCQQTVRPPTGTRGSEAKQTRNLSP